MRENPALAPGPNLFCWIRFIFYWIAGGGGAATNCRITGIAAVGRLAHRVGWLRSSTGTFMAIEGVIPGLAWGNRGDRPPPPTPSACAFSMTAGDRAGLAECAR